MTPLPPPPPSTGYLAPKEHGTKPWYQVLHDCGYPTTVVVLDFETFFSDEFSLSDISTMEYIASTEFEVLGLSHLIMAQPHDDYQARTRFEQGEGASESLIRYLQKIYGDDLAGCTISHHNASFDARILAVRYGVYPRYIIDTADLARAWKSRTSIHLKDQVKDWKLPDKGDTASFKGWTNRRRYHMQKIARASKDLPRHMTMIPTQRPMITDEKWVELAGYAVNDVMRQWELFTLLLPRLSNPKTELRLMRDTLDLNLRPALAFDFAEARRIIDGCEAEIDKTVQPTGLTREEISGDKVFEAALEKALLDARDFPPHFMKDCKVTASRPEGRMFALAKDDGARKTLAKHASPVVRNLIAARGALDSWPLHLSRVRKMAAIAKACGGMMPVTLKFHGAHTGRDSGAEKINLQNLPKRGHELVTAIRGLLVARPGEKVIIADLAAIEARVLAWVAGQADLVEKFAKNEEIYCGFATKVLGWVVRKPVPEHLWEEQGCIPALEKRNEWARNSIGKIGILGGGYGLGARDQADKTEPNYLFAEAGLDAEMADKIVAAYRREHPKITRFWRDIENAFRYVAKFHRSTALGKWLRFDSYPDCDVVITLPNSRELHYHSVRVKTDEMGREQISVYNHLVQRWEYIWGGGLTENVVQAISRDIMMEAAIRCGDREFRPAHRVHDELIGTAPEASAETGLAVYIEELRRVPEWGPGLPLNAEGHIADRYGIH